MLSSCTWASELFVPDATATTTSYLKGRARKRKVSGSGRRDKPQYEAALTRLLAVAQPTYATTLPTARFPASSSSSIPLSSGPTATQVEDTAAWLENKAGIDPAEGHLCNPQRARRKRQQVANLMQVCHAYIGQLLALQSASSMPAQLAVIEFCCGSGHVALPLAALYPSVQFILLDNRPASIHQAEERAAAANLQNVTCRCEDLHDFSPSEAFHLGIALHACGPLTDLVMDFCVQQRAAYVLCPCCIGKVQASPLEYPRSSRYRGLFPDRRQYESMASAADLSVRHFFSRSKVVETDKENATGSSNSKNSEEQQRQEQEQPQQQEEQHQQHRRRRLCKTFVEMDRGLRAEEAGYLTRLLLLTPRECTPKNDLLCGYPGEWEEGVLGRGKGEGGEVIAIKEEVEHVVINGDDAVAFDVWFGDSGASGEGGDDASDDEGED